MRCRYLLCLVFWVAVVLLKLDNEQVSFSYASGDVRDLNFADGWWNEELQLGEATKSEATVKAAAGNIVGAEAQNRSQKLPDASTPWWKETSHNRQCGIFWLYHIPRSGGGVLRRTLERLHKSGRI